MILTTSHSGNSTMRSYSSTNNVPVNSLLPKDNNSHLRPPIKHLLLNNKNKRPLLLSSHLLLHKHPLPKHPPKLHQNCLLVSKHPCRSAWDDESYDSVAATWSSVFGISSF